MSKGSGIKVVPNKIISQDKQARSGPGKHNCYMRDTCPKDELEFKFFF